MSATPTDAEWETARRLWPLSERNHNSPTVTEIIAQALADQRARYEAVADELDQEAERSLTASRRVWQRDAAARIRQVAK